MEGAFPQFELDPDLLRRTTNPAQLGFETTRDLEAPTEMVGQSRAEEAIELALEISDSRYNIFAFGPPGTGRQTTVMSAVERVAKGRPAPRDWLYAHNFDTNDEPRALALPAGQGRVFARDVDALAQGCRRELRRAFSTDTYAQQRGEQVQHLLDEQHSLFTTLAAEAQQLGFLLEGTPTYFGISPLNPSTAPAPERFAGESSQPAPLLERLSRAELEALPIGMREQIDLKRQQFDRVADRIAPQMRALEEEANARAHTLDVQIAEATMRPLVADLIQLYTASADAVEFLQALANDMVANVDLMRTEDSAADLPPDGGPGASDGVGSPSAPSMGERSAVATLLHKYHTNLLVAHKADDHAPVIYEINPMRTNLVGRQEFGQREGLPFTDHTMIKPGAFHRANGGFLIMQASDLLNAPLAWDAVKRVIRFGTITLDGASEVQSATVNAIARPEPIPASIRIILIGDQDTFDRLQAEDPEFRQLFKVRADFSADMERTAAGEVAYARYTGNVARSNGGPPLSADAVACLIEEGSREAGDQGMLSTVFGDVRDLTIEACFWARKEHSQLTSRSHVDMAIRARERIHGIVADTYERLFEQATLAIDTDGEVVGQINGLSILPIHDAPFGKPTRITARASPGLAGVKDIEREIAQGGPLHTKGVHVLSGYLAGRFAQEFPLCLSASLCFEQMTDGVDGDSASAAELFALLSTLADAPIKQSLAVTGAVTQRGEIQAIGGVSMKVEGFFRLCQARELTGRQGVIIPRANVRHLMLREAVIDAVRARKFHIYAIATVDEGITLLTGIPAGQADAHGRYLEGTINARVLSKLRLYSERVRDFASARPTG